MSLKIKLQLPHRDNQCKNQLLELRVSDLHIMKDFAGVVYGLINSSFFLDKH